MGPFRGTENGSVIRSPLLRAHALVMFDHFSEAVFRDRNQVRGLTPFLRSVDAESYTPGSTIRSAVVPQAVSIAS